MSTITRYVLVDRDDHEGGWEYTELAEAIKDVGSSCAVIAREYEYSDSEVVWTPDGSGVWPPDDPADEDGD